MDTYDIRRFKRGTELLLSKLGYMISPLYNTESTEILSPDILARKYGESHVVIRLLKTPIYADGWRLRLSPSLLPIYRRLGERADMYIWLICQIPHTYDYGARAYAPSGVYAHRFNFETFIPVNNMAKIGDDTYLSKEAMATLIKPRDQRERGALTLAYA